MSVGTMSPLGVFVAGFETANVNGHFFQVCGNEFFLMSQRAKRFHGAIDARGVALLLGGAPDPSSHHPRLAMKRLPRRSELFNLAHPQPTGEPQRSDELTSSGAVAVSSSTRSPASRSSATEVSARSARSSALPS